MNWFKQCVVLGGITVVGAGIVAAVHPLRPPLFQVVDPELERWRLSIAEAKQKMGEAPVIWVDARKESDYEAGHLPGALLLNTRDWANLMFESMEVLQEATDRPVIVYCGGKGKDCDQSEKVAVRLRELVGLNQVFVLQGDWQELITGE